MISTPPFHSLEAVARHLPFHLNETEQVNDTFQRWRRHGDEEAEHVVELWTYCFIRRYFIVKLLRDSMPNAADLEMLVERAYCNVQTHRADVADGTRYAQWVSVLCKNTFLNYLRRRQSLVSIDQENGPELRADTSAAYDDAGMVREAVGQAIARLPAFLRQVARLRFLDNRSYGEIERITGKPLPTVRSYVNKTVVKFRSDSQLLVHIGRSADEFSP